MRAARICLFCILLVQFWASQVSAKTCFTATIDGAQAGTGSPATGIGKFILNDEGTELTYHITFSGLVGSETAAHIHSDAEGGSVVHTLSTNSPKYGTWTSTDSPALSAGRVQDLLNGLMYVNIHSDVNPGGEIRGQIIVSTCNEACFEASIDGPQAGTASPASGTGLFMLDHTNTLQYNISFSGLLGTETAAHIHNGAEGGAVVHTLVTGSPKVGQWEPTDSPPLTPTRIQNLLNGQMYVNIHSDMHPGGEIRGQILQTACASSCFEAPSIDGTQAGTGSTGTGRAVLELNHIETELIYHVTFSGLIGSETAAHIHNDNEGGAVVKDIGTGDPKFGTWTTSDTPPLTPARVADLRNGDMYVNIHSTTNPGGEIRGQIMEGVCNTTCFSATLDASQTGSGSPGTGMAYMVLNHTESELSYQVSHIGLGSDVTAAHLHNGKEGGAVMKDFGTNAYAKGVWHAFDTPPLTLKRADDLKTAEMSVDVHTVVWPNGEISGVLLQAVCQPTAVPTEPQPRSQTALKQNHPNPFNPSTRIEYSLAERQRVTIRVYDVSGRLVRTLLNDVVGPGDRFVTWDGVNLDGETVSSGVYFYRLVTPSAVRTRKMVLLK